MRIVTAYYEIPSKQPPAFYRSHIERFLKYIKTPILFFTDAHNYKWLHPLAGENCQFILREFEDLTILKLFPREFWELQKERDPEPYHTWQLGALWANKSHFVNEAIHTYPSEDPWYMWMDAGCIRKDEWIPYLEDFTQRDYIKKEPGIYVQAMSDISNLPLTIFCYQTYTAYIAGALILFHRDYINIYIEEYSKLLYRYSQHNTSGISDQHVIATMTQFNHNWLNSVQLDEIERRIKHIPDIWFFFIAIF